MRSSADAQVPKPKAERRHLSSSLWAAAVPEVTLRTGWACCSQTHSVKFISNAASKDQSPAQVIKIKVSAVIRTRFLISSTSSTVLSEVMHAPCLSLAKTKPDAWGALLSLGAQPKPGTRHVFVPSVQSLWTCKHGDPTYTKDIWRDGSSAWLPLLKEYPSHQVRSSHASPRAAVAITEAPHSWST